MKTLKQHKIDTLVRLKSDRDVLLQALKDIQQGAHGQVHIPGCSCEACVAVAQAERQ